MFLEKNYIIEKFIKEPLIESIARKEFSKKLDHWNRASIIAIKKHKPIVQMPLIEVSESRAEKEIYEYLSSIAIKKDPNNPRDRTSTYVKDNIPQTFAI